MFERRATYRAIAEYLPRSAEVSGLPYFRGNWATGGEPLVDGAETILHNQRFVNVASQKPTENRVATRGHTHSQTSLHN